jgi:hypothetical protein
VEDWYEGDDFWNGYLAHPDEMKQWTMDLVDDAIEAGIYVIIDWHIHNDPSNFTEQAKTFFNEMSALCAASHKQDILDRAEDALFGTNQAGHNPNGNMIPLIATEWGTCDYDATYNDFSWSETWIDFLDENLISWCNWSFSSKDEASSILKPSVDTIGPWYETNSTNPHTDGCDYTESGLWVKERMAREPQQVYQLGDVNHDGVINIVDALLVAQYYVGLEITVYFDPSLADVNKDGSIDSVDALLIAQYYSGLIDSF